MFSTGDTVSNFGTEYIVAQMSDGQTRVYLGGGTLSNWIGNSAFTLVSPAKPNLTGMTQFYKDIKERSHDT